jgi:hypothetical protein
MGRCRSPLRWPRWDQTPGALLAQIRKTDSEIEVGYRFTGTPVVLRTADGHLGLVQAVRGTSVDGLIAAVVIDGAGVEVVALAPPAAPGDPTQDVVDMLISIRAGAGDSPS